MLVPPPAPLPDARLLVLSLLTMHGRLQNNGVGPMMTTCFHAEQYQIEQCRRLKALPGGEEKPCIVYWNGQVRAPQSASSADWCSFF